GNPGSAADQPIGRYTGVIAALLNLNRVVLAGASDPLMRHAEELAALAVAKEQISQQHAVLLAAMLSGALSAEQLAALRMADTRFGAAVDAFNEVASPEHRQRYDATVTGDAIVERERLVDTALSGAQQNAPLEIVPANWDFAAADTGERIRQVETSLLNQLRTDTVALGDAAWNGAIRDAVVVAALMVLAVLLLAVVVRSLLRPLRTLRTHAFDVADRRLPDAVEKLRVANDKIDETTVDPVPVYSREEVGEVARAFDTVHVQAVRLAAEQAMLRGTLNDIFLNLAGRSQRLVGRQLKLIEKLERGEQDPEQLGNLFQLDHLATRMRRNSENLLVLAGGRLRRGAEGGMPVLDMLRAAISEVA
ncbi:MAG: nitrate- and nitrite sensing domain-containing protein, partial [Pseudonocardiaceae bacterium]